jgi:G3E family GTPase
MVGHIHIYLLSGFLGAGKTTLLQRFLNYYSYRKVAVLKNEVGDVSVDAQLIQKMGVQVVEINNGSIFCTCRHDAFIQAMKEIAAYDIDMLFIEGSGIADPANFSKDLVLLLDLVGAVYHHIGNICMVDASSFMDLVDLMPSVENQVKYSNMILLNKIDLVQASEIGEIEVKLQEINPAAHIVKTSYAALDMTTLETIIGPLCLPSPSRGKNTLENKPKTLVLKCDEGRSILDWRKINEFFKGFLNETLRIKGFFKGKEGWMYVDGVQTAFQINTTDIPPLVVEIVVIFRPNVDLTLLDLVQQRWEKEILKK